MTVPLTPDEQIADRAAFSAFLTRLRADHAAHGGQWENATLEEFLAALESWVGSSPGWYRNFGHELPQEGDWTFFARALTAARVYE
ncbi:hypothetical protein [Streptomyces albidoflavus]|uniref:DUF7660 family protein n=1 Tax=Streptomyces albidoflavus TaxID=1886 RepID=UPI0033B004C9